jgi:8-oxo-dGTP diphosphatase
MADESLRPKVGVGVIIHDGAGNIVMGERAGSHGAGMIAFSSPPTIPLISSYLHAVGTFQLPGGHLEHGESFAATAARETLEETGLVVGKVKFLTATNDVFPEGKHYVTVFVTAEIVGEERVPKVCSSP